MSMLATFVQVDPSLLDDPSRVETLFEPELPAAFDPERMREAARSFSPGRSISIRSFASRSSRASAGRRRRSAAARAAKRSSR